MNPAPEADGSRSRRLLRLILRDPITHFIIVGALLFAGASAAERLRQPTVRITEADLEQIAASWQAQTLRAPSVDEMQNLVRERIDEEVLAAEAHRLGLDEGDVIIRRRLAQKMAFISDDLAVMELPPEAELEAYYQQNKERFSAPARFTFRHVVFGEDRAGPKAEAAAAAALARAGRGGDPVGDATMLPPAFADLSQAQIAQEFGEGFAAAIAGAQTGRWFGPIRSPYGAHLVRIEQAAPATIPAFAEARAQVVEAWLAEARDKRNAEQRDAARKGYRIIVDAPGFTP